MATLSGNIEIKSYFSSDFKHRYFLKRKYATDNPKVNLDEKKLCFILINPSYADELLFDKTNMLASNLGVRNGFNEVVILNMYSLITKESKEIKKVLGSANGIENDKVILKECLEAAQIIISWGTDNDFEERRDEILDLFMQHHIAEKVFSIEFINKHGEVSNPAHLSRYLSDNPPNFTIEKFIF